MARLSRRALRSPTSAVTTDAERLGAELRAWADAHDQPPRRLMAHHVLGVAALSRGAASVAARELATGASLADRLGYRHPGYIPVLPDAIEAHALTGDEEACRRLAGELDGKRQRSNSRGSTRRPVVDAASPCWLRGIPPPWRARRGGDGVRHARYRLDAARTQILVGRALRRGGQRSAAAAALDEGHARLTAMHAVGWAEQADAERGRVAPTAPGDLDADRVAHRRPRGPGPPQPGDRR